MMTSKEKIRADKALLIILGASNWPNHDNYKNDLTPTANPFQNSANGVRDCFIQKVGLQEGKVKNLFDSDKAVNEQLQEVKFFLERNEPTEEGDLFIYYVGHGEEHKNDYYLFVNKSTTDVNTAISITRLLDDYIIEKARAKRCYLIIDACYAGMVRKIVPERPHGVVLFCASPEDKPVKWYPDNLSKPTLYTGALLEVLKEGKITCPEFLSCNEINSLLDSYLKDKSERELAPQYYVIGKQQNVISNLGIFPNPAYRPVETVRNSLPYSMKDIEGLPQIKWHITTSNKGGVGKTLLSMMLLTHYSSNVPRHRNIDFSIPINLPLVIDLNGVNTDLRRLLVTEQNLVKGNENQILHINLRGESLCIVRVDQEKHPFFLGWLTGDPFRMLNARSFFKLLATIKGEGIKRIKEELNRGENITIDTVIVDTNYHFCNIFSPDIGDYEIPIADNNKNLREFLWEKDQFFIWFIWVYGQIRNLTLPNQVGGLGLAPDVARMAAVSNHLETYLNNVKHTHGDSPFFHVINPVGLKSQGIDMDSLKESLSFWWEGRRRPPNIIKGEEIGQLNGLVKDISLYPQKFIFARMQNQMVVALNNAIEELLLLNEAIPIRNQVQQPNQILQRQPPVFADREQFSKMLSILKNHLLGTGGRPKNLIPISTYHKQLVSYQDAKHIELIDIDNFEVYQNFRKLLTNATN